MREAAKYQTACNARGIRIYPVLQYGTYFLEVEYNKSKDWEPRYITKLQRGKIRFDPKKTEWIDKIRELYKELYETKVLPKLKAEAGLQTP